MKVKAPDQTGRIAEYRQSGTSIAADTLPKGATQVVNTAAHVVADPFSAANPGGSATGDCQKTIEFRHQLAAPGSGIAKAMDSAQRGMGLTACGLELIRRRRRSCPTPLPLLAVAPIISRRAMRKGWVV